MSIGRDKNKETKQLKFPGQEELTSLTQEHMWINMENKSIFAEEKGGAGDRQNR